MGTTETDLHWTAGTRADLPALRQLLTAIEHLDEPTERQSLDDLQRAFDEQQADPQPNLRLGRDIAGTLVGYGWNHPMPDDVSPRRVFLRGGVHPGWRGRGIGRTLLGWQLDQARAWCEDTHQPGHGTLQAAVYTEEKLTGAVSLYTRFGFLPVRWFADMSVSFADLGKGIAEPRLPTGLELRPFAAEFSEQTRIAHNEAFAQRAGAKPVTAAAWAEQLAAPGARPDLSWLVLDCQSTTTAVVGYAMNSAEDTDQDAGLREGWTDRLGVRPRWRGRGVAQVLLAASMRSFADAGMEAAGLGVDSDLPSGGFALYRKLGYRVVDSAVMYARDEQ